MFRNIFLLFLTVTITTPACGTLDVTIKQLQTPATLVVDPTKIALEIEATSMSAYLTQEADLPPLPTPAPTQPASAPAQLIAYMRDGKLLITHITNGMLGNTTEYTLPGTGAGPVELSWSPSGIHLAFSVQVDNEPHVFYLWNLESDIPIDIGPGSNPAWSPDGQSIAYVGGQFPDYNIWIATLPNPAPRPLTFENNFAWGSLAFTPNGQALVTAGQSRDFQAAVGNFESYALEYVTLDGSGARSPFEPGTLQAYGGHLPSNLQFSQNGKWLAFITSHHISACGSLGAYHVISADGSIQHTVSSSSLETAANGDEYSHVYIASDYTWSPSSEALVISGQVRNCDFTSPDMGKSIGGPQLSIVGLDGTERLVIPGLFYGLSYDCTETLIAAGHFNDIQDANPTIKIYSAQTGQLVLILGEGSNPAFQPSASCPIAR